MASITFDKATLTYPGAKQSTIEQLSLDIKDGEFVAVVGPSGSGKSTTLRMISGLEPLAGGDILMDGKSVKNVPPSKRNIAMVFQTYALYPHMTVEGNMDFALKMQKVDPAERKRRVKMAAESLDLLPYLNRRPKELSGGQRQRVAMGRAIVRQPSVFLMDEPLSNLDARLRVATRAQIVELQQRLKTTTIYVTHDQIEAMTMADRIAVIDKGHLQQLGSPRDLYNNPSNTFVAGFLGSPSMNIIPAGGLSASISPEILDQLGGNSVEELLLGIRPEALDLTEPSDPRADIQGTVILVENTGSDAFLRVRTDVLADNPMVIRVDSQLDIKVGQNVGLMIKWDDAHWFNAKTGQAVSNPSDRRPAGQAGAAAAVPVNRGEA